MRRSFILLPIIVLSSIPPCIGQLIYTSPSSFVSQDSVWRGNRSVSLRQILEFEQEEIEEIKAKEFYRDELISFDKFATELTKKYSFNGDILISLRGKVLYYNSFGFSNPIKKDSLRTNERFQLASVSKQFAAASILRLEQQGLLSIEDPVQKYLPEFKFQNVKIEHLLNHSGGIVDYLNLLESSWQDELYPKNEDVLNLINQKVRALNFAPGTEHMYSNTGYVFLALIVERITQVSYPSFLQREFFKPLEMKNTFLYQGIMPTHVEYPDHLNGYERQENSYLAITESVNNGSYGDKGIYTTSRDLHKWFKALKNGRILNEQNLKRMFYFEGYESNSHGFGMGFKLEKNKFGKIKVYHNGKWEGFRNGLLYYPYKDLHIILLSHTSCKGKNIVQQEVEYKILELIQ